MSSNYFVFVLFCASLAIVNSLEWYDSQVLYQIYTPSFADSDGNGVGDFKGIKDKAQYLKDLGVGAIWLTPFYKSPMKDNGYDISNFTGINEIFGNLEDLKALIKTYHDLGIKVLFDLVPNHTSDEHPWFKDSIANKNEKGDYYVWVSADKLYPSGYLPPNNWDSLYGGSAWEYNKDRQQFYLHQFKKYQPDLNYRNPKVLDEIKNVMRYWLDIGVDGFRVDAVPYLVEDKNLRSENQIKDCNDINDYNCFTHYQTKDLNETYQILEELGKVFDENKYKNQPRKLFLEAYTSVNNTIKYFSKYATPFNFGLLSIQRDWNATQVENLLTEWTLPKENRTFIWATGNHDNSRIGTKMGEDMIDAVNMLSFMAPGNTVTYYGEEIGMVDAVLNTELLVESRNPERTPMQWNNSISAGFSNSTKTWLPVNPNYWYINKEKETADKKSHLSVYKLLVQLQNDIIEKTNYTTHVLAPYVFALKRSNHLLVINLDDRDQEVNLTKIHDLPTTLSVRISSVNSVNNDGDNVKTADNLWMRPRSGIIFKANSSAVTNASSFLLIALLLLHSLY
uniref:alpha-glucosidase n=1 Tax=Panstrongylus lignarius TaxID=156445 RepID=A0A224XHG6_9HEMI